MPLLLNLKPELLDKITKKKGGFTFKMKINFREQGLREALFTCRDLAFRACFCNPKGVPFDLQNGAPKVVSTVVKQGTFVTLL